MSRSSLIVALQLLWFFIARSNAKIEYPGVEFEGRNALYIRSFGFEPGGHFQLDINYFTILYDASLVSELGDYRAAFVLQRGGSDEARRIEQSYKSECFHESVSGEFDSVFVLKKAEWQSKKRFVKEITEPGNYNLYFSRCDRATVASFEVRLIEYNLESDGHKPNYLSAGESPLPTWLLVISLAFLVEGVGWTRHLMTNRPAIRSIHHLMTSVLCLKLVAEVLFCVEYHFLKTTGSADNWRLAYDIFSSLSETMSIAVVVLIGTGWSFAKPFLADREKKLLGLLIVAEIMIKPASILLDETTPRSESYVTQWYTLYLPDLLCWIVALLPVTWSVRQLKQATVVSETVTRNIVRLRRFRTLVACYVLSTRVLFFMLAPLLPYRWEWLATVFREVAALLFYGATGYLFQPYSVVTASGDQTPESSDTGTNFVPLRSESVKEVGSSTEGQAQ